MKSRRVYKTDSAGTLPKPCNEDFIGIESLIENFTGSGVQQSRKNVVLDLQKIPLQALLSVPAESVSKICLQR
jgi:hypothetical protein